MNLTLLSRLALAGLLATATAQAALAQASDPASAPAGPRVMPQAAIDACKGKAEGDAASFTGRQGNTVEGHCRSVNGALAAVPDRAGLRGRLISPEARAACNGKAAGASVTYQDREGSTRNGVCTEVNGGLAALSPEMAQRVQERREKR